ncbi:hypothetical protein JTB14_012029 [Gonioctena quinquepunctata]|nr:hypothetical protein JTB14_012029 [Gonioctena quinquepunctata]
MALLYTTSHKHIRNLDSGQKNASADEKSYKFLNENPRLNLSNKNTCLTNIHYGFLKSKKKKQKLDIEEIIPAEQLEDNLFVEEKKKTIIDCFKKPEKKKIRHNSENDNCPDSTIDNSMFHTTEFLELLRKKKLYDFEDTVNDRMERDNPKSIKWRSPLVFSPAVKSSPKISFSEKMPKENNESEEGGNISNETLETSVSSENSRNTANLTINIQKTPKQPKTSQKSFKSRGTKFPLCDSKYYESPKNSQSKEFDKSQDYMDICSTPFLEKIRIKEHEGSTKKKFKQCEPSTATDYYTQFLNQSVTQKEKHNEKQEYQKHIPSSSASNEDKENIFGNEVPETESQKDFSSLRSIDNSQIIREQSQNDFESPRNNLTLSQSRPLMFEQNLPHCQVNSFRTPDICDLGSGQDYFSMQPRYLANRSCHPSRSQSLPRAEYPMSHYGQYGPARFLHPAHESQKFRPNKTLISANYMESKIPYMPTAPDLRGYSQIRPYFVRSDSSGPYLNQSRYPSVESMPENCRYPQIPSMRYFHDGDVPFKQDYFNPDMTQNSKLPDFHLRREHSDLDAMHSARLNCSQMERIDRTAVHQDCHFGRKVSFEGSIDDRKTRETKSLSQREDSFIPALNASSRHIYQERPMISDYENQENIFLRNQEAQDLNRSFMMRNSYYQPTMDHYIPKNPHPPSGFSNSQNFQFQNRGYLDDTGGGSQPYCVMPRNSDFQQLSLPNDKEYVMNKFLYSLNQQQSTSNYADSGTPQNKEWDSLTTITASEKENTNDWDDSIGDSSSTGADPQEFRECTIQSSILKRKIPRTTIPTNKDKKEVLTEKISGCFDTLATVMRENIKKRRPTG